MCSSNHITIQLLQEDSTVPNKTKNIFLPVCHLSLYALHVALCMWFPTQLNALNRSAPSHDNCSPQFIGMHR